MKKAFFLTLLLFSLQSFAQLRNINPDPNGEPWMVGGLKLPSEEALAKIPTVILSNDDLNRNSLTLPSQLDNTTQAYFRPIFNQSNGSCAQSSGVAYNFTYEINRERGTSAAQVQNQFPSHYTYDFLNDGSGDNGSFYTDGWDIIMANGCPNIPTYGGSLDAGGAQKWMTGYSNYESGMNNRIKEYFGIDVSTPAGLNTLKHWMFDHLEGAATGSLVNFSAGVASSGFNITNNNIITSWGFPADHAMTFVGWDDSISYDYNNDGQITNNIDINNDGVVDMRDWERGALIMANTWGTFWANGGKAYVMYRTLAESGPNGGITSNKVYGIRVKSSQTPQLKMRVKMSHDKRKMIKISAGIATDINANAPEHILDFPLFNRQGGEYPMQGLNNSPISLSLDISPLLSYIDPNTQAKFFLIVNEDDPSATGSGTIVDFSIVDDTNTYTCTQHNVNLNNNADTILSISASTDFDKPQITTSVLPTGTPNQSYSHTLTVNNGSPEYEWKILYDYNEGALADNFPAITGNQIATNDNDDGFGTKTLDFNFPFYGQNYTDLTVSTDGSITFEPGFSYLRTESAIKSHKVISVFASDLMIFPADGDGIFYEGDATHATFRWKTSLYGDQAANVDVAVTLYPDGRMKFFYGNNITQDLDWAAGISDGDGKDNYKILTNSGVSNPSNQKDLLTPEDFPLGMGVSVDGNFQGTAPNEINTWAVKFKVTDNNNISDIKTLDFETVTAGIEEQDLFKAQFYPNPVVDYSTLHYELKNAGQVHIAVYDLTGKEVANLRNAKQAAGAYQLVWQPQLKSGIYIYKIETDKGQQTGKIIVK